MEEIYTQKISENQISKYLWLICLPDVGNTCGDVIIGHRNFQCDKVDVITQSSDLH